MAYGTASFIPSSEQQAVRDLTRSRMSLLQERGRLVNRIQKVLEDANLKLASVVTDIMGVTGHTILTALVAGQHDPEYLAHLARGSLVKKQEQLKAALQGKLTPHHRVLLEELLHLVATLDGSIGRLDREIAERLRPLDALIERIDEVTGLSRRSIEVLLGELGWDMSRFPDAAHAASHTQTYLGEQYRRISARRGAKRAAVAVGHSILVIFYHMVKTGESRPGRKERTTFSTGTKSRSNSGWFDNSNAWAIPSFCSRKHRQLSPEGCRFAQPLDALFRPWGELLCLSHALFRGRRN